MASRDRGTGNNISHNSSSASGNLRDKITSKIRDCLSSAHRELCGVTTTSQPPSIMNENNTKEVIDVTVDENNANNDSLEWHTPCDDLSEQGFDDNIVKSPTSAGDGHGPRVYRALFQYKPTRADELAFEPGDVVVLLNQTLERGWLYGEHQPTGKTGLFPSNYVEVLTKAKDKHSSYKKLNAGSPLMETRVNIRPGRLTALEHEIAVLRTQVELKPSQEQVRSLEEAVDRLKIVASAVNSPATVIISPSPLCKETPLINAPVLRQNNSESSTATALPVNKPSLAKAVTEAVPNKQMNVNKKPGPVRVPSCFMSKTPTNPVNNGQRTPTMQNSSSKAFKPAGFVSSRTSTSPASLHAVAVRVNAVATPSSLPGSPSVDATMDGTLTSAYSERRAGVVAAGKLKRRSITHYTKKCQKNFSKLCNFYEKLAEESRLGHVIEKTECSSTSPSSLFEDGTSVFPSVSSSDHSTSFFVPKPASGNKSKDNPFQNKSFDSTIKNATMETSKRFPAFNKKAVGESISSVLMKQQMNKAATSSLPASRNESPTLINIRRPPMNKLKTQPVSATTSNNGNNNNNKGSSSESRHVRCSSADFVDLAEMGSVNDLRRRFETMSTSGASVLTNALNSQPKQKRLRKNYDDGSATPTSASRRAVKSGKDSGLGFRQTHSGDSTVDLFNIAQQVLEDSSATSSSLSSTFSVAMNDPKNATLKKATTNKTGTGGGGGETRCSSASMLNEAGIFDCSLTWTETSSDSTGDHSEHNAKQATVAKPKAKSNAAFVEV